MSQWTQGVVTTRGLALIAASQLGDPLTFTKVAMGEGIQSGADLAAFTGLIQEVMTTPVLDGEALSPGLFRLRADLRQAEVPKAFYWREVGIYAKGADGVEVLYAYNYAEGASFIPHGGLDTVTIQFPVAIAGAAQVSAVLDESAAYVLQSTYMADKTVVCTVSIAASAWRLTGGMYYATVAVPLVVLGDYAYTVAATPETQRVSGEAGGVLMLTPTVAGQAQFAVPEVPEGTVVMVIKREVVKEA